MKNKFINLITSLNPEALIWLGGITLLFFFGSAGENHFTICPLANTGLDFCPGCGLGSSIHYLLHLKFSESIQSHPLGIAALIILIHRIITILKNKYILNKVNLNSN